MESKNGGPGLGAVRWYAPWRKYVFYSTLSIFDSECLGEIVTFIKGETDKHKE